MPGTICPHGQRVAVTAALVAWSVLVWSVIAWSGAASAQGAAAAGTSTPGTASSRPPVKRLVPAKQLFGAAATAAPLQARAIGRYSRGCLAGAQALPINGPAWQAMRLSRNRNWGHPVLVSYLERFARETQQHDGWPGLLVGDMAQPRGGPMLTGHASHQVGLDADIWLTPMPKRTLSKEERESMSAISMLGADKLSVDPARWTQERARIIKRAASSPHVARIFVHPAIKKAICEAADGGTLGKDRFWLGKVRPWWGHHYHFHIRMKCPKDSPGCVDQPEAGPDDGCGTELADWYKRLTAPPKPPPAKPLPPKPPMTIEALPAECRVVLAAGGAGSTTAQQASKAEAAEGTSAPSPATAASGASAAAAAPLRVPAPVPARLGAKAKHKREASPRSSVPEPDLPPVFRH